MALFGSRRRRADRPDEGHAELEAAVAQVETREAGLAAIADGIVVFGRNGTVAYANDAARTLSGRRFTSVDELSPRAIRDLCRQALSGGRQGRHEYETSDRAIDASVVASGSGGAVLMLRDVTESRRTDRIRRDFVANTSHELKTPVSSILALTEALKEAVPSDPEAADRFIGLLENEANRLARLVSDLLDLSRLETEAPTRSRLRLGDVVLAECDRLQPRTVQAGLHLVLEPPAAASVLGSPGDLELLVHNLLDNAIRYSPDGGEVRVTVEARNGFAELKVSDTGIGIASRDVERIFERFYRADPARSRQTGGTGLGLSIVRHVAESHGGTVAVQSVLGAGTTFTVRLPLEERPG